MPVKEGVTAAQMGWMAAVIDLKGKVTRKKNKTRATPQIVLYVETKELAVIRRLGELVGTEPEYTAQHKSQEWFQRGCVEHCPEAHVHHDGNWQMPAIGKWSLTGAAAAMVLWNLLPYLSVDRGWDVLVDDVIRQATLQHQGSGATVKSITRLVQLGWKPPPSMLAKMVEGQYRKMLAKA